MKSMQVKCCVSITVMNLNNIVHTVKKKKNQQHVTQLKMQDQSDQRRETEEEANLIVTSALHKISFRCVIQMFCYYECVNQRRYLYVLSMICSSNTKQMQTRARRIHITHYVL